MQNQAFGEVQEHLKMTDGFELFCRRWPAVASAERVVLFLHGIEVHSGAFRFMGPELANAGSEVYAFDRRGFGNSKEPDLPRGDTHNFERHLEDINEVVSYIRQRQPNRKLFLFGHSIGCAYALWYAVNYPSQVDGLILAASPIKEGFKLPFTDTFRVGVTSHFEHHSRFDFVDHWPQAFRESEEYQLITSDELCTKTFGLGYLYSVHTKVDVKMPENAEKISKPALLLHGESDIIALPEGSKLIYEKLASTDKTLHTFPGADHWLYQSIIPTMSSKYTLEQKRAVSRVADDWLKVH